MRSVHRVAHVEVPGQPSPPLEGLADKKLVQFVHISLVCVKQIYGIIAGSIGYSVGSQRSSTIIGKPSVSVERGPFASNKPFSISADTVSRARRSSYPVISGARPRGTSP